MYTLYETEIGRRRSYARVSRCRVDDGAMRAAVSDAAGMSFGILTALKGLWLWSLLLILTATTMSDEALAVTLPLSTQFDITGFIQAATLDTPNDPLSGGTITVNNQVITVPRNTILQMPATALAWAEVFTLAPEPYKSLGQSGLALNDGSAAAVPPIAPPMASYEAHVVGNRVGNQYIAGLIWLAQHSLQSGQGYINFIDLGKGEFRVGGIPGDATTGERVRVNDPIGRFGRIWTPDPRFTIDEDNPTVRSETGYPMCVPRSVADDPWCPQKNRPLDPNPNSPTGFQMVITMPAPNLAQPPIPLEQDARRMAPFEIGDYVTYSGILVKDDASRPSGVSTVGPVPDPSTGSTLIAAWTVTGNVGLFTTLGSAPAYAATDVALLGVGGLTVAGGQEATVRTRFEGFTSMFSTDPAAPTLVDLFGVDVACSGTETLRDWGTIDVDPGPPNGAVPGRWRFRPPSKIIAGPSAGVFLPATREMVAQVRGVPQITVDTADGGGLLTGRYTSPIGEFLFPENAGTGQPIVANNFEDMPFLANGSGPLGGDPTAIVGQLSPWPGDPALLHSTACTAASTPPPAGTPVANAGSAQTVRSGASVTLTGSATGGTAPFTFAWTQVSGTPVTLTQNATTGVATFTAPTVTSGAVVTLSFQLVVTDGAGAQSTPASVTVTVQPAVVDTPIFTSIEYRIGKQRLTVNVTDTASANGVVPVLTLEAFDASGTRTVGPVTMTNAGGGSYTAIMVGVPQPASVKVSSNFGGSATTTVTTSNPIVRIRN